jgi:hypothetical protein
MIALLLLAGAGLELTVSETAGIRRFDYPVAVKLTLKDDLTGKEKFRLLGGAKPMAAQFRPAGKQEVWLDFTLSPEPHEKKALRVEYGPDVEAGPERAGGVSVAEEKGAFVVRTGGMTYAVPADLGGLLGGVTSVKLEYMKAGSKGLWVDPGTGRVEVKGLKGTVVRQGPVAAALAFAGKVGEAEVSAGLTFQRSKSWVEVEVGAKAKAIGADLKLDLASPAWVDFGAGSGVYVALKKGETAAFRAWRDPAADDPWETLVGRRPYVIGHRLLPWGGWAHAMDRTRCTAIAVDGFGDGPKDADQIEIDADGGLRITRKATRFRFWLHFVPMPPHVGAVTSPQSMLAPLKVEVKTP